MDFIGAACGIGSKHIDVYRWNVTSLRQYNSHRSADSGVDCVGENRDPSRHDRRLFQRGDEVRLSQFLFGGAALATIDMHRDHAEIGLEYNAVALRELAGLHLVSERFLAAVETDGRDGL